MPHQAALFFMLKRRTSQSGKTYKNRRPGGHKLKKSGRPV
jgi:hypothetical protein